MYKLKTIVYSEINKEKLKCFPEISSNIIENSSEYKMYNEVDIQRKLYHACVIGNLYTVKYYTFQGADINECDSWAIVLAAASNHLNIVKYLASISKDLHLEVLDEALYNNNLDMVKYFMENTDYKIDYLGDKILGCRNLETLKYLISKGVPIDYNKNEALEISMEENKIDIAEYLIAHGARIE